MKAIALGSAIALAVLAGCSRPVNHIPEGAEKVFDLRTGNELTVKKAAKADGFYGTIHEDGQFIAFVRYNPAAFQTTVVTAERDQADSTSALCLKYDAFAGINGSYFNMDSLTTVTFIKDDGFVTGATTARETFRTNGALVLNPEEIRVETCDTTDIFEQDWEVLASGPVLVDDGVTATYGEGMPNWKSFYNKRHPRSLVGKDADGGVWLVVVDGRFPGEAEGMTIAELTGLAIAPPTGPPVEVDFGIALRSDADSRVDVFLAQQVLVDECLHLGILDGGQLAVAVEVL